MRSPTTATSSRPASPPCSAEASERPPRLDRPQSVDPPARDAGQFGPRRHRGRLLLHLRLRSHRGGFVETGEGAHPCRPRRPPRAGGCGRRAPAARRAASAPRSGLPGAAARASGGRPGPMSFCATAQRYRLAGKGRAEGGDARLQPLEQQHLHQPGDAVCPTPGPPPAASGGWSPVRAPSAASPDRPATRRTPGASGNRSAR